MLPAAGCYLDAVIGGQEMHVGETPLIGEDYVACVVIDGFPAEHTPNITAGLNTLAMPYRFTQRMIFMDTPDATRELGHYRRKWGQKVRGFVSILFNSKSGPVNEHALDDAAGRRGGDVARGVPVWCGSAGIPRRSFCATATRMNWRR